MAILVWSVRHLKCVQLVEVKHVVGLLALGALCPACRRHFEGAIRTAKLSLSSPDWLTLGTAFITLYST
eukprot:6209151-Amphidinium_carterae.1